MKGIPLQARVRSTVWVSQLVREGWDVPVRILRVQGTKERRAPLKTHGRGLSSEAEYVAAVNVFHRSDMYRSD